MGLDVGVGTSALSVHEVRSFGKERSRSPQLRPRRSKPRPPTSLPMLFGRLCALTSACGFSPSPPARPGPRPQGYWESSFASASRCFAPLASGTCPTGCTPCASFSAAKRCAIRPSATSAGTQARPYLVCRVSSTGELAHGSRGRGAPRAHESGP